ncbi:hypothetical protein M5K25_010958 [Dendrobium thyrsiflorum]|uniref:Uncharacterized protein n=1 Tax=Dendrobium thyrsiflorum TaxID=117978 RepID=A0ABD0V8H3_DENTH
MKVWKRRARTRDMKVWKRRARTRDKERLLIACNILGYLQLLSAQISRGAGHQFMSCYRRPWFHVHHFFTALHMYNLSPLC